MRPYKVICVILCTLLLWGCASTVELSSVEHSLALGNYDTAVIALEGRAKNLKKAQGELVYSLDSGMVQHYARNFGLSNQNLANAEQLITSAFTKSITATVASYIVNDNTKEYPGEDFEDVYSNVFMALNYQMTGKTEDAMVEIRRATEKQQVLRNKYEKLFSKTASSARNSKVSAINQVPVSIEFSHSALVDYLGLLCSRSLGAEADKRYYQKQVSEAFQTQPTLYPFTVPKSVEDEMDIPSGLARVNVIAFSGLEPKKIERVDYVPITNSNWMKIALPVMQVRQSVVARVDVTIGTEHFTLEKLEDLSAVAANTFKLRSQDIYNKTIIRSTMKAAGTAIVDVASHEAAKNSNSDSRGGLTLFADILTLFSNIFNVASEQADLRMSHFFPSVARVGGINVPSGTYDVTIEFKDSSGNMLGRVIYKDFSVVEGKLNLCEADCLR